MLSELKRAVTYPVFDDVKEAFNVLRLMLEFHHRKEFSEDVSSLAEESRIWDQELRIVAGVE